MSLAALSRTDRTAARLDGRPARRVLMMLAALAALVGAAILGSFARPVDIDPDLARLLRFMALLKGAFAALAAAACWWRLARPAAGWRVPVYVLAPGLMAGGALALWQLQAAGIAAALLHAGLFALLAAALTDGEFIPSRRR